MHKISDEQVDFILRDIKARGIEIEDLQNNLLDHMCCIIENEMPENTDFYTFYENIVPAFFVHELKEIQTETEQLIRFKHYYAMKRTLKISGITSAILTLVGAILKTLHLPGAGITIILGGLMFSLIFLPLMIVLKFKEDDSKTEKWVFTLGFILAMGSTVGVLFKLMYWPYANFLMRGSITLFVFAYVPLYFITRIRREDLKFNTTVNAVLMMACGGMLYALYNLGGSNQVKDSLIASHKYMEHNYYTLRTANQNLYQRVQEDTAHLSFYQASEDLLHTIEQIKILLVSEVEGIDPEQAKDFDITQIERYQDVKIVQQFFEHGNDERSLSALLLAIQHYNTLVRHEFPHNPEKEIAIEKLQLSGTTIAIVLQQLTQIQLHIASAENSALNVIALR